MQLISSRRYNSAEWWGEVVDAMPPVHGILVVLIGLFYVVGILCDLGFVTLNVELAAAAMVRPPAERAEAATPTEIWDPTEKDRLGVKTRTVSSSVQDVDPATCRPFVFTDSAAAADFSSIATENWTEMS